MERIAEGDRSAVQECVDRYGPLVWSLARRFCAGRDDAEDAAQEIFIELWTSASRYDPNVAGETTFVSMIARRRLIDRMRKHQRQPVIENLEQAAELPSPSSGHGAERASDAMRAAEAMNELRPEQRNVLRLSIYHGLSHGDIAEKLGMPLGTVKTHARRGLLRIRERMSEARASTRGMAT